MQLALYLSLLCALTYTLPATTTSDLCQFLEKLEQYQAAHKPKDSANMPVAKPQAPPAEMPSPQVIGYMEDPKTGLQHYFKAARIYDPETGYSIDLETGKLFKGKTEVSADNCKKL